jgi:cytoskeletal protein CcmA (bactofilin family)
MAKDRNAGAAPETVISIIGPGMQVVGECITDGTLRIEGSVQGSVRAGKAVVVGKDGSVEGDVFTQDAVVSGRIVGTLVAESRLELQATCRIDGEVSARRMQLEEGAMLNGTVHMGENLREARRSGGPDEGARSAGAGAYGVPRNEAEQSGFSGPSYG